MVRDANASIVDRDIERAFRFWGDRLPAFVREASTVFLDYVDPPLEDVLDDDGGPTPHMGVLFTEWALFEWLLPGGRTLLEAYASNPPADVAPQAVARLMDVVRTQFFSCFRIRFIDAALERVVLQDMRTGRHYDVAESDSKLMASWQAGTVAQRIACVENRWQPVGRVRLHDKAAPGTVDLGHENLARGYGEPDGGVWTPGHASFYLELVRAVAGRAGVFHDSMRVLP